MLEVSGILKRLFTIYEGYIRFSCDSALAVKQSIFTSLLAFLW